MKQKYQVDDIIPVVYVSKYALTQGIYPLENVKLCEGGRVWVSGTRDSFAYSMPEGDWHYTHEEAVEKAKILAARKKKSLEKALQNLEKVVAAGFVGKEKS